MHISIELDDYEIANLQEALKFIPNNGAWLQSVKNKIQNAVNNKEEFPIVLPNGGISLYHMEKHINFMKWKDKNKFDMCKDLSYNKEIKDELLECQKPMSFQMFTGVTMNYSLF